MPLKDKTKPKAAAIEEEPPPSAEEDYVLPVEVATPSKRFIVQEDKVAGFRVLDTHAGRAVDGPFRDREDAEARAAKREIASELF